MGTRYRFNCPQCGCAVESTGGDAGMMAVTAAPVCAPCRARHDVVVERFRSTTLRSAPACGRAPVPREWRHPGKCPRCGVTLLRGGAAVLWD
jgi:predicted RNA-binding Zn-ribbon protein involved in translation (DUF1610 family)